jgi:hypothetical protein
MRLPWTKALERLDAKVHNTFTDFRKYVDKAIKEQHEKSQKAYYTLAKSEQFKHNDHKRRLIVLETILKDQVDSHHQANHDRELAAAVDADK